MYKPFFLPVIFLVSISCKAQHGGAKMFRDNPLHFTTTVSSSNVIYDTKAWSFFAEAPVRSTPLVHGNMIFTGTTKGKLLAINKANGN
jgi:hypothetical protein